MKELQIYFLIMIFKDSNGIWVEQVEKIECYKPTRKIEGKCHLFPSENELMKKSKKYKQIMSNLSADFKGAIIKHDCLKLFKWYTVEDLAATVHQIIKLKGSRRCYLPDCKKSVVVYEIQTKKGKETRSICPDHGPISSICDYLKYG